MNIQILTFLMAAELNSELNTLHERRAAEKIEAGPCPDTDRTICLLMIIHLTHLSR